VQNSASELCIGCHQDKTRGPEFGTHPVGGMPWAIPRALVDAGARIGPNPRELTCQVCHTPHGAREEHLLVMGTSSNELCTTCHDQMRPGMFRDDSHTEHPLRPIVSPEQAAVVEKLGTKLGPNQQLICLSCHKLHHGQSGRFMLADDLTDGRFCLSCHAGKASVLDTSHDLRTNFPEEKNRLGMTASSGGPCSACHMFHRYARAPEPSDIDPGGKCITCHQPDRCASAKALGSANHPGARCVDCHDPHSENHPPYLVDSTGALCARCHQAQTALAGGPHDYRQAIAAWPDAARQRKDECLACHRPHGSQETGLFQFAGATGGADAGCRVCHASHRWDVVGGSAALHPRETPPDMPHGDLPLVAGGDGEPASIGCKTCHDPHADFAANPSMLRLGGDAPLNSLCATCHVETRTLALTGHGSIGLSSAGLDARTCGPCHVVHGSTEDVQPDLLWSSRLAAPNAGGAADVAGAAEGADAYCRDCHRPGGAGPVPRVATHPQVVMNAVAAAESNGSLPLFDERGVRSPTGSITCRTCHLPHGRTMAEGEMEFLSGVSPKRRRAARLLLRPFEPPNICTTCHGADALRRFLYFHDRQGRIEPTMAIRADDAGD
jgi:predicted CXXCH cytochrome family protein